MSYDPDYSDSDSDFFNPLPDYCMSPPKPKVNEPLPEWSHLSNGCPHTTSKPWVEKVEYCEGRERCVSVEEPWRDECDCLYSYRMKEGIYQIIKQVRKKKYLVAEVMMRQLISTFQKPSSFRLNDLLVEIGSVDLVEAFIESGFRLKKGAMKTLDHLLSIQMIDKLLEQGHPYNDQSVHCDLHQKYLGWANCPNVFHELYIRLPGTEEEKREEVAGWGISWRMVPGLVERYGLDPKRMMGSAFCGSNFANFPEMFDFLEYGEQQRVDLSGHWLGDKLLVSYCKLYDWYLNNYPIEDDDNSDTDNSDADENANTYTMAPQKIRIDFDPFSERFQPERFVQLLCWNSPPTEKMIIQLDRSYYVDPKIRDMMMNLLKKQMDE